MIPVLNELSYKDKLKKLKLSTLRYRNTRGDMIKVYKILTGKHDAEVTNMFDLKVRDNTRGHQ